MTRYLGVLVHGVSGGEGRYEFEGPDDLLRKTPVRIMRAFMESIEGKDDIGYVDYEINAALKSDRHEITTVIGELVFEDDTQSFMCMLSYPEIRASSQSVSRFM